MDVHGKWWIMSVVAVGFDAVGRQWFGGENKIKELDGPGWYRYLKRNGNAFLRNNARGRRRGSGVGYTERKLLVVLRVRQRFLEVGIVGWLILLPLGVGWDIMGYELYPLPPYPELRNCSYSIMLICTDSPSTPQVHLPRPGPTISSSGLSPASDTLRCIVHKWGGRPPFTLWLPVTS